MILGAVIRASGYAAGGSSPLFSFFPMKLQISSATSLRWCGEIGFEKQPARLWRQRRFQTVPGYARLGRHKAGTAPDRWVLDGSLERNKPECTRSKKAPAETGALSGPLPIQDEKRYQLIHRQVEN